MSECGEKRERESGYKIGPAGLAQVEVELVELVLVLAPVHIYWGGRGGVVVVGDSSAIE